MFCRPTASAGSASGRRKTTSVARQGQIAREAFFRGVEPEDRRNVLALRRDEPGNDVRTV
jgi:hypothetical protein